MMQRLSVDVECKGTYTCDSVWSEDTDPEYLVVVGKPAPDASVPLADNEIAIRVKRQVITDAQVR